MLSRKAAFFEVVGLKVGFACTVPIKAIGFYFEANLLEMQSKALALLYLHDLLSWHLVILYVVLLL